MRGEGDGQESQACLYSGQDTGWRGVEVVEPVRSFVAVQAGQSFERSETDRPRHVSCDLCHGLRNR